jgi:hypothetical protein
MRFQIQNTYSNIPTKILSFNNTIGKMGSAVISFLRGKYISQPTNEIHDTTAITNGQIIATLDHSYRVPASSSAKTTSIDAASMSTTPMRSKRRKEATVKRLRRRKRIVFEALGWSDWRRMAMNDIAAAPAGALFAVY